jgi:hypothetical protein
MKENILKKEFKHQDVQRLRNLVQGKQGEKIGDSIGYTKPYTHREENEIWEEDGRKWTIKDGIKQNITKLDSAKKIHVMPIFCPKCKKPMKKHFDKSYYLIHKMCFDCVIVFETELKRLGLFDEYYKSVVNSDIDGFIADYTQYVKEELSKMNNSFITEQGDVEKWIGGPDEQKVIDALNNTIDNLNKLKK